MAFTVGEWLMLQSLVTICLGGMWFLYCRTSGPPSPPACTAGLHHMYIKYSKCTEYTVRQFILLNLIQVQLSIVTSNKIQTSEKNLFKPQESKLTQVYGLSMNFHFDSQHPRVCLWEVAKYGKWQDTTTSPKDNDSHLERKTSFK